jgi:hypothetical protein
VLLAYSAFFAEILPIILYLIFLKRNRGTGLWVIFLYCVLSVLTEAVFLITHQKVVYSGWMILQFSLFSFFFYSSLKEKKFKYIPIVGALVFYAFSIVNFSKQQYDSISASLASVLVIIYCILLLYEMIKDPNTVFVYYNKKFWIIIAFFIYFSSTTFLYIFFSTLSAEQRHTYWAINNFFEILKNILFSVSFIMKKHHSTPLNMEYADN